MIILAWVISLGLAGYIGYHYSLIVTTVRGLQVTWEERKVKPDPVQSTIIDLDDPVQTAKREHEKRMRVLNPELYDDL